MSKVVITLDSVAFSLLIGALRWLSMENLEKTVLDNTVVVEEARI